MKQKMGMLTTFNSGYCGWAGYQRRFLNFWWRSRRAGNCACTHHALDFLHLFNRRYLRLLCHAANSLNTVNHCFHDLVTADVSFGYNNRWRLFPIASKRQHLLISLTKTAMAKINFGFNNGKNYRSTTPASAVHLHVISIRHWNSTYSIKILHSDLYDAKWDNLQNHKTSESCVAHRTLAGAMITRQKNGQEKNIRNPCY